MNNDTETPNEANNEETESGFEMGEEVPEEASDGMEELSFDEIKRADRKIKSQRKTIHIAVPHPEDPEEISGVATFTYRMLSEEEADEAEDAAVNVETKRNKEEVTTDTGALRATLIKYGVTEGPAGFKLNNERAARELPRYIKEPLANAIEDFNEMEESERVGFP